MLAIASGERMNVEIHRADPRLRRLTLIVMSAGVVVALLAMVWVHQWLRSTSMMPTAQLVAELNIIVGAAMSGVALCLLLLAAYAARLGRRIADERRWPLARSRVLRDTQVRSGNDALALGRMLNLASILLIVLGIAAGILGWHYFGPSA